MLASRVRLIAEYVRASQRGEVEFNHEILRQVNALAHRLPVLNSDKFRGEFYNVSTQFISCLLYHSESMLVIIFFVKTITYCLIAMS